MRSLQEKAEAYERAVSGKNYPVSQMLIEAFKAGFSEAERYERKENRELQGSNANLKARIDILQRGYDDDIATYHESNRNLVKQLHGLNDDRDKLAKDVHDLRLMNTRQVDMIISLQQQLHKANERADQADSDCVSAMTGKLTIGDEVTHYGDSDSDGAAGPAPSFIRWHGFTFVVHPDFPPHYWNGYEMVKMTWEGDRPF